VGIIGGVGSEYRMRGVVRFHLNWIGELLTRQKPLDKWRLLSGRRDSVITACKSKRI